MATALFSNTTPERINDTIRRMDVRVSMKSGLNVRPAASGYVAVDGAAQQVMFLIGAVADEGEDFLERFTK